MALPNFRLENPTPNQNAGTKSFMGALKNEMLQDGNFTTETDACIEIFDFTESCSKPHRKHSALDCHPSAEFAQKRILTIN